MLYTYITNQTRKFFNFEKNCLLQFSKFLKHFQTFSKQFKKIRFWAIFGLKFGFLAKNNVGLCPPDLKRPTGGDFSSRQVNFDESCTVEGRNTCASHFGKFLEIFIFLKFLFFQMVLKTMIFAILLRRTNKNHQNPTPRNSRILPK